MEWTLWRLTHGLSHFTARVAVPDDPEDGVITLGVLHKQSAISSPP